MPWCMSDCVLERTVQSIINSFCGCAGERCMALPVVVVENAIADRLVEADRHGVRRTSSSARPTTRRPAWARWSIRATRTSSSTGSKPAIKEGAKLVLDGRKPKVPRGCEKGFFVGPTIFDHVTEEMSCGREEIFGPVLCIKRVDDFEQGLAIMNASRFANGSVIYTESGHYAREFAYRTDGGMVGVNVGIPVPLGIFGFTGHKQSFFGDLHCMGRDGFIFFTESKNVTTTWFTGKSAPAKPSTWDGTMTR